METEQATLIPESPITGTLISVPLDRLPAIGFDPPLDGAFAESIKRFGVLQPIAVRLATDEPVTYTVIEGRRRVAAARKAKLDAVPGFLIEGDANPNVLSVMLNEQRAANTAGELAAVEALVRDGHGEREIAHAIGAPVTTIRKLLRLSGLPRGLRAGLDAGKIAPSVAYNIAKLPVATQKRLEGTYAEKGKLTATDVSESRRVGAATTIAGLPNELFAPIHESDDSQSMTRNAEPAARSDLWHREARAKIEEAIALLPEDYRKSQASVLDGLRFAATALAFPVEEAAEGAE